MEIPISLLDPAAWIAFLTLTALELVLGIDNVIFISILVDRLPAEKREKIRRIGLFFAMIMRIALLLVLSWIVGATASLFSLFGQDFSPRDLILLGGGVFLLWKSTQEIHHLVIGDEESHTANRAPVTTAAVLVQIMMVDLVFSLDSIITAVGLADQIAVMVAAVIVSVLLMMLFARAIGDFVSANPTIKMLALSFLMLVGVALVADGFSFHVPKGYIYFAMAFSLGVEMLNLRMRKRRQRAPRA
ncbi:TerC family protein [Propionivibrio dicarboxylicus]|uniref:Membrane protein TerC, possibly involved in tellurium resistance n=1 Tax=Propionivibrio dicarboxylicus TaxID=83767 RepID=A0A1G8I3G8_9RHOO|nr:TerC family protein [Propionivibrio dicarboxylicus]SDI13413.1 Membrane protein TerC, possibly involved in tellurium resistance [Propionivibrio dicarboxylicus]